MKFPFLFIKPTENTTTKNATLAWPWPTCVSSPKTLSFRINNISDNTTTDMFKTINSAFVQENDDDDSPGSSRSYVSLLQENRYEAGNDSVDNIVVTTGLLRSSDRLFFEPGETNSILEQVKTVQSMTVMAVDSCDPFLDFRVSMEEMVIAHRLRRWECLEDLLASYLEVNEKINHGYIIGAFVDLLLKLSLVNCDDNDDGDGDDEQRDNTCSCSSAVMNQGSSTLPLLFCSSSCSLRSPSMEASEGLVVCEKIGSNSCSLSSISCKVSSSFSSGFL